MGATAGATAISWLAPNWLNKTIDVIQPQDEPDDK
jgi:cation-transporting ATPase I